uniref:CSON005994 protein n=1 Tax=Culicoides sonorensis TaxID=179676 RepID=A0A336LW89_CULSO
MNNQNDKMNHGMAGISRERSFVRTSGQNIQNANKRRSLAFHQQQQQQNQQIREKPAIEIYRPPNVRIDNSSGNNGGVLMTQNKLNVHAEEFQMKRPLHHGHMGAHQLQQSKSTSNVHPYNLHMPLARMQPAGRPMIYNQLPHHNIFQQQPQQQQTHVPLMASPSSSNVMQPRVKFAPEPTVTVIQNVHQPGQMNNFAQQNANNLMKIPNPLQRSKSLTSADNLINRSFAGMSLSADITDIGQFTPEIQAIIDKALADPNQLSARVLMELATKIMERAIEGRRYALPVSRLCIQIIAKEKKETFLEAILNTCRQWYNERDKVLGIPPQSKIPARPKFTSFMSFLTEMFCQLKRRQLQLKTHCDGAPPPLVLLTLLEKCCEDCVKPPVRSLAEIECLFFVLTCIGRDLEQHLPQQLEMLLTAVRDAFLNSSASVPAIRRTLLQLIELQASRWQLPGNTVLYYYPTQRQTMTNN